ncbi:MAG TPA: Crp/Fnr family transcriptional regulator [Solirubrobacterales bacterium]|nr:Crp/Fnr family transcriptional regulator [Solirubrobacterales bacterium]
MSPRRVEADIVSLLEVDPDLAERVPEGRQGAAREAAAVRVERVPRGRWDPPAPPAGSEGFGALVLSGFLVRRVGREGHFGAELLGPGDLLRPWQVPGRLASTPFEATWQAIATAELAILDADFVARVSPFPQIAVRLVDRAMLRSRHLALELAVVQQRRVEQRLRMLFWLLADRWGRVTKDGVRLVAPLTHALLAELVAARRPTVSAALGRLAEAGELTRVGNEWTLRAISGEGAKKGP